MRQIGFYDVDRMALQMLLVAEDLGVSVGIESITFGACIRTRKPISGAELNINGPTTAVRRDYLK